MICGFFKTLTLGFGGFRVFGVVESLNFGFWASALLDFRPFVASYVATTSPNTPAEHLM